jgi:hypothetical protein
MNKIFFAALALAASTVSATAATVEWRGIAILTTVSTQCGSDYEVGNAIPIRYRPSGLGTNGTKSRLAFHQTFYSQSYNTTSGRFATGAVATVDAGSLGAGYGSFTNVAKVKLVVTPQWPTTTTATLAFTGDIQNFVDLAGCNVSFRAAATLRP